MGHLRQVSEMINFDKLVGKIAYRLTGNHYVVTFQNNTDE